MQTLTHGYRGLRLIAHINADRILFIATLGFALMLAGHLASVV
ncbi:hypothetical protein Q4577_19510 [Marinovum sp. 2_MG-2023]|nr:MULTISPECIES: hypothetical protein [unclassified Marinovum]MDO6732224.1 hypothetical protein [Marinovum sp. 2_MG-2023]MDO6781556.1 hypothetical protein [Marinovum sp. 1_MG-2023]